MELHDLTPNKESLAFGKAPSLVGPPAARTHPPRAFPARHGLPVLLYHKSRSPVEGKVKILILKFSGEPPSLPIAFRQHKTIVGQSYASRPVKPQHTWYTVLEHSGTVSPNQGAS